MTANNNPSYNWMELASKLPTALIFIIIVNYSLLSQIIELYIEQNKTEDTLKLYTLIAIGVVVLANVIIIVSFAYVKLIQEKSKPAKTGSLVPNEGKALTP